MHLTATATSEGERSRRTSAACLPLPVRLFGQVLGTWCSISLYRSCFLHPDSLICSPLPSVGSRGCHLQRGPAVPHCHRYYGFVRLLHRPFSQSRFPSISHYLLCRRRGALPSSWGIPLKACPGLGTPAARQHVA